ncbi:MAG: malonyl-ACP O-methyltransferase BioC [Azonexus sp.]|jgi:malonyl-CoA O-methyltransferase|nr:malonyl-ACP O-methyltransferase BioC [Azonexus sp.]
MTQPARTLVRQAFDQAAERYDLAASIQRHACHRLALGLPAASAPSRLLDAGCGTGYGSQLLSQRFPAATVLALDLASAMLQRVPPACLRVSADLEHLPLAAETLDLYWSSMAVQWCDLGRALREARRVLRPGGHLAVSTLGPRTFHELREAFAAVDQHQHTIMFTPVETVRSAAASAGFSAVHIENQAETTYHPNLRSLLRSVKSVGANQLGAGRRRGLLSPRSWQKIEAAYETRRSPAGLPLTYDLIYLHASV